MNHTISTIAIDVVGIDEQYLYFGILHYSSIFPTFSYFATFYLQIKCVDEVFTKCCSAIVLSVAMPLYQVLLCHYIKCYYAIVLSVAMPLY